MCIKLTFSTARFLYCCVLRLYPSWHRSTELAVPSQPAHRCIRQLDQALSWLTRRQRL